jgi:hypothetical protein
VLQIAILDSKCGSQSRGLKGIEENILGETGEFASENVGFDLNPGG